MINKSLPNPKMFQISENLKNAKRKSMEFFKEVYQENRKPKEKITVKDYVKNKI